MPHRRLMVARVGPVLRVSIRTPSNRYGLECVYSAGLECHIGRGKSIDLAGQGHMWHWKKKCTIRTRIGCRNTANDTRQGPQTMEPSIARRSAALLQSRGSTVQRSAGHEPSNGASKRAAVPRSPGRGVRAGGKRAGKRNPPAESARSRPERPGDPLPGVSRPPEPARDPTGAESEPAPSADPSEDPRDPLDPLPPEGDADSWRAVRGHEPRSQRGRLCLAHGRLVMAPGPQCSETPAGIRRAPGGLVGRPSPPSPPARLCPGRPPRPPAPPARVGGAPAVAGPAHAAAAPPGARPCDGGRPPQALARPVVSSRACGQSPLGPVLARLWPETRGADVVLTWRWKRNDW